MHYAYAVMTVHTRRAPGDSSSYKMHGGDVLLLSCAAYFVRELETGAIVFSPFCSDPAYTGHTQLPGFLLADGEEELSKVLVCLHGMLESHGVLVR